eukprot:gene1956-3739_t
MAKVADIDKGWGDATPSCYAIVVPVETQLRTKIVDDDKKHRQPRSRGCVGCYSERHHCGYATRHPAQMIEVKRKAACY